MDVTVVFDRDEETDLVQETVTYERHLTDEHLHSVLTSFLGALQAAGYSYVEALTATKAGGDIVSTDQWVAE